MRFSCQHTFHVIAAVAFLAALQSVNSIEAGGVQTHRLDNGLSVIFYPIDRGEQIALVVLYAIGEDHDPAEKCGLGHLTEHVYVTAAAGDIPARTVDEFMRRYPNAWNAQTGADYTVFATVFPANRLDMELSESAARMRDLRPTAADVEREKPRLLQELHNMYEGSLPLAAMNHARQRVHPSAIGHRKGGLPDHVARLTIEDVTMWWSKHYKPRNATLVLAGAFDPMRAQELVDRAFGSIPTGEIPPNPRAPTPPKLGGEEIATFTSTGPHAQGHACIALSAPEPDSENYAGCLVLVSRMWMRSGTFGGKPQVTFSVLDDPTLIAVSQPIAAGATAEEAIKELRSFLDETIAKPLDPVEKNAAINNLGPLLGLVDFPPMMFTQNLYGVAFSIGRRAQLGIDASQVAAKLKGLTSEDLATAARANFAPDRQVAVVVIPSAP